MATLYSFKTSFASGGFVVEDGIVTRVPPILKRFWGVTPPVLINWIRSKGGNVREVETSERVDNYFASETDFF